MTPELLIGTLILLCLLHVAGFRWTGLRVVVAAFWACLVWVLWGRG